MKILVTGASGFIGSSLVEYFVTIADVTVVAMVRKSPDVPTNSKLEYRVGEISEVGEINIFLRDIDVVVHCAGRAHVMNDKAPDPQLEFMRVNTKGTLSLAKLSALSGVKRFIFLSTIKVMEILMNWQRHFQLIALRGRLTLTVVLSWKPN
jgi:UDP-glucose 4-epimerase